MPAVGDEPLHQTVEHRGAAHPGTGGTLGSGYINGDANPAHIIYECLNNATWGLGLRGQRNRCERFQTAANTLASAVRTVLALGREQPLEEFIAEILRHIDGTLYVHPRTGKFVQAGPGRLQRLQPPGARCLEHSGTGSFSRGPRNRNSSIRSPSVTVIVPPTKDAAITVPMTWPRWNWRGCGVLGHGRLSRHQQWQPGVAGGAGRPQATLGAAGQATLIANRQASNLNIGDVFKFTWPELGVAQLVMRVVRVSYGTLTDGRVRIECVEDIFGLPSASYVPDPDLVGVAADLAGPGAVSPAGRSAVVDGGQTGGRRIGDRTKRARSPGRAAGGLCESPSGDSLNVKLLTRQGSAAFAEVDTMGFTPNATVTNAIDEQTTVLAIGNAKDLDVVKLDTYAYLDNEIVAVKAINLVAGTVTVERGVLDTVPAPHLARRASGSPMPRRRWSRSNTSPASRCRSRCCRRPVSDDWPNRPRPPTATRLLAA